MIGAILAGLSLAGSGIGAINSARANNAIDRQLKQRRSVLENWYDKEYNTDYLNTAEAKNAIQVLKNNMKTQMAKTDQGNVISGASDEAQVATADKSMRSYGDQVTRLAGYGTQYKDSIRREYQGLKMNLDNLQAANLQQKSQNWNNFMNNAMNAGIGFAQADGMGAFDKWDGKIGEWRKDKILQNKGGAVSSIPIGISMPTLSTPIQTPNELIKN